MSSVFLINTIYLLSVLCHNEENIGIYIAKLFVAIFKAHSRTF